MRQRVREFPESRWYHGLLFALSLLAQGVFVCQGGNMELKKLDGSFSVCQVEDYSAVNWTSPYCFAGKTDEENSLDRKSTRLNSSHVF